MSESKGVGEIERQWEIEKDSVLEKKIVGERERERERERDSASTLYK